MDKSPQVTKQQCLDSSFEIPGEVHLAMFFALIITCLFMATVNGVDLKVGIYNSIPDIGGDNLSSYKNLIQNGYTAASPFNTVDAVVDKSLYDAYGNLEEYLTNGEFDMLEIDTISLRSLIEKELIIPINGIASITWKDFTPEAIAAVEYNNKCYAYPALLCGNFLIGLSPATKGTCDISRATYTYDTFMTTLTQCEELLSSYPMYERLFGGKMNDVYGYYLPDIYVDGYIDIHGSDKAQEAVTNVLNGDIDMNLCSRLTNFVSYCSDKTGSFPHNKCLYNYTDSYVQKKNNIYMDITNQKTMLYFGFSENLAQLKKNNPDLIAYGAISAPMGNYGWLLQYTDALVISAAAWNSADDKKKAAIVDFVAFFTSQSLRESILFGKDLSPQATRYLLQANMQVYSSTEAASDPVISDFRYALERGIHTPINDDVRGKMQQMLMYSGCICSKEQMIFNKEKKDIVEFCVAGAEELHEMIACEASTI